MRYETVTVRHGENMGPIDWDHPKARDMPSIWREAERNPDGFLFSAYGREIIAIAMYDGWPYWTPTPAIHFWGPLGPEWNFFDSYGAGPGSIRRKATEGGA